MFKKVPPGTNHTLVVQVVLTTYKTDCLRSILNLLNRNPAGGGAFSETGKLNLTNIICSFSLKNIQLKLTVA
jgi:hypothetical protein